MKKRDGERNYIIVAGVIFLIVAGLHLLRVLMGWSLMIENQVVPLWLSAVAVVVLGVLGAKLLRMSC